MHESERERVREEERVAGFFGVGNGETGPQTHIMRIKSSYPNHVDVYGPKLANRVFKTRFLFLKIESLRLDI